METSSNGIRISMLGIKYWSHASQLAIIMFPLKSNLIPHFMSETSFFRKAPECFIPFRLKCRIKSISSRFLRSLHKQKFCLYLKQICSFFFMKWPGDLFWTIFSLKTFPYFLAISKMLFGKSFTLCPRFFCLENKSK